LVAAFAPTVARFLMLRKNWSETSMTKRVHLIALLLALFTLQATAQQLPEPKLMPTPSTQKQAATTREGVALHDKGDYDGAIRKYEEVLAENPSNMIALYEMAYSYSAKKDYKKSLEIAYKGAQYQSEQLAGFYLLIGNDLDIIGESQKAIDVYKKGIKTFPDDALLHFNLGIAYRNANKIDDAKKSLKSALTRNPQHPGSHLILASIFYSTGYRTPALFAAARFLTLEPATQRSAAALKLLRAALSGGASSGKNANEISIVVEANPKKDEGDFSTIDFALGLTSAAGMIEEGKNKTEAQRMVDQMNSFLAILEEQTEGKKHSTFVYQYYVPYFVELKQRGHVEAFVYHVLQSSGLPGVNDWINENSGRVMQFLVWSKSYQWPKDLKP
jgi:tetratricopeptide (TPR) repeat protein